MISKLTAESPPMFMTSYTVLCIHRHPCFNTENNHLKNKTEVVLQPLVKLIELFSYLYDKVQVIFMEIKLFYDLAANSLSLHIPCPPLLWSQQITKRFTNMPSSFSATCTRCFFVQNASDHVGNSC